MTRGVAATDSVGCVADRPWHQIHDEMPHLPGLCSLRKVAIDRTGVAASCAPAIGP
jgi:hypothetical protein